MAHYAFLDDNNIVTEVIVGIDETELIEGLDPETWYSNFRGQTCKRTSYNGNIRRNFAGVGFTYLPEHDVFVVPQPFASWQINNKNGRWEAPVSKPEGNYTWDQDSLSWLEVQEV